MISAHPIPVELTYDFRTAVFDMPREGCRWPEDSLPGAFHFGGYIDGALCGVCSFAPLDGKTSQGYGLAVLPEARGRGLGELLLLTGEDRLRRAGVRHVYGNVRVGSVGFYEKYGWSAIGEPFRDPEGQEQVKMVKDLSAPFGCRKTTGK